MTGPLVTVVVLKYNGAERIPGVLRSLAAQDLPARQMAVWVVDNASADGSLELLKRDFPWVRTIVNPTNDGFAGGNNVVLREITTPFVALLNDDAYPSPDWLRRLLELLQQPGAERVAAVSSKIVFLPRFLPVELATPGSCPAHWTAGGSGCVSTGSPSTAATSPTRCCGTGSPTGPRGTAKAASAGPAQPACCWCPWRGPGNPKGVPR